MTPQEVAEAWHSVTDEWFVRLYKGKDKPWEVCHLTSNVISDETLKVVSRHGSQWLADRRRQRLENEARGDAVLKALRRKRRKSVKAGDAG